MDIFELPLQVVGQLLLEHLALVLSSDVVRTEIRLHNFILLLVSQVGGKSEPLLFILLFKATAEPRKQQPDWHIVKITFL